MIDVVLSTLWGVLAAFGIILLLIMGLLCLLTCCCCQKSQGALKRDLHYIARNHNLISDEPPLRAESEDSPLRKREPLQSRVTELEE